MTATTETKPGESLDVGEPAAQLRGVEAPEQGTTGGTADVPFDAATGLLCDRRLHRPTRTRPIEDLEDEIDLAAIEAGKDDPGVPWEQVKDELGL